MKSKKGKKKKAKGSGMPDPQYLMMLKMLDPNIDMVVCSLADIDNRAVYGH